MKHIIIRDDLQHYGKITKKFGGNMMEIEIQPCSENDVPITAKAIIRGNMRKRVWMNIGDYVLVSSREYENDIYDIVYKYSSTDVRFLISSGEIVCEKEKHEIEFEDIKVDEL